ncbi:hypothetical protein [Variovorax rhizosphaerae]|uniref:Toxic anion resistance protein n=1 Tax=Variovorax rhizosphaerae TaxID=1836200 RepID=A0ABU8WYI8_9BURK
MKPRTMGSPRPLAVVAPESTAAEPLAVPSFLPAAPVQHVEVPAAPIATQGAWTGEVVFPQGMSPALVTPEQQRGIVDQVNSLSITDMPLMQIAGLGSEVEVALHKSLGAFLDRIDKGESPQVFRLVSELNTAIKAEELDALADRIVDGKLPLMDRILGKLSPKNLTAAGDAAFESLRLLVAGKTRKLGSVIEEMEKKVEVEKQKAMEEARSLERLKDNYRARLGEFVMATLFLSTLLGKARQELADIEAAHARGDYVGEMTLQEAQDKVQALESRALAVEAVLTKLPAEQLIIRQIQTATIQTVQEVTTTAAGRFASIKMTLLTLHGAMTVQNLQRTDRQGAELDANLNSVRNKLVKQVVTAAANAPGDNRLAQANQLKGVTRTVSELVAITEKARIDNQAKFEAARTMLVQARTELTGLGAVIRPDKAVNL